MGAARWLLFERCARELMELAYSVPIPRRHIVVCPLGGGGGGSMDSSNGYLDACCRWAGGWRLGGT